MWNKENHKKRMGIVVSSLVSHFASKGINFTPDDGLENVIFKSKDKEVKISHHSFYRYSGIACVSKEGKEKNTVEHVPVTDEMWMNSYVKPIIELHFNLNKS